MVRKLILLCIMSSVLMPISVTCNALEFGGFGGFTGIEDVIVDKSEWLAADKRIIDDIAKVLSINENHYLTFNELFLNLGYVQEDTHSIGFGTRIVEITKKGGYANYYFTVLVVDEKVARTNLYIHIDSDGDAVREYLKATRYGVQLSTTSYMC